MERQNVLWKVSETNLFSAVSSYEYTECDNTDQTNGVVWLLAELEKLRGIRK